MVAKKKPFHETVAERLIEQLKEGTAPWQKPWTPGSMPQNPTTGKRYKGINAINLMAQGRGDSRWMTYKQAKAAGAQVRKGEKGTTIQYWKFSDEQKKFDANGRPVLDGQGQPVKETVRLERPRVFLATVFNAEQIDGLPPLERKEQAWNAVERAEVILTASGANIHHGDSDRAFYRPSTDSIHLPNKEQFPSAENYYGTALHELGHWTGHSSRLDRDLNHPFGSEGYAKEELRAECFSLIMSEEIGIDHDPNRHAAYVGSWIKALQDDPLEIFRATADAEKIASFVIAIEQEHEQEQEEERALALAEIRAEAETQGEPPEDMKNQWHEAIQIVKTLSDDEARAVTEIADERLRLFKGEIEEKDFEHSSVEAFGARIPGDWNGVVQVQGNIVVKQDDGWDSIEPAHLSGQEPEIWSVYGQRTGGGEYEWIADKDSQDQADELASMLKLVDALSETDEDEQAIKIARIKELFVRSDPDASDDDISGAKEARKTLEGGAMIQDEAVKKDRTYINVPYREKDEAKELGARWDRQKQSWYVPPGVDTKLFARWSGETSQDNVVNVHHETEKTELNPAGERQYLAVPYGERGAAKAAGAKWDRAAKSWYVGASGDLDLLKRWLPENVQEQQAPAMLPREEFAEAMKSLGCVVSGEHPVMDGNTHRVQVEGDKNGERAGFYVGHLDGHPAGYISNNRTGVDMKWKSKGYCLTEDEKSKLQVEAAEKLKARSIELKKAQESAAIRVSKQAEKLVSAKKPTSYMESKGIQPHTGVLTDSTGKKTYIPAYDANGKQWTMQYIQEDGTKRFAKDSRKEGCFHIVGGGMKDLQAAPAVVLLEGYATAATTAEALGFVTVAAFDSGNLSSVAKALHESFPSKPIVIFGDDDRHQELTHGTNPGRTKAEAAAKAVGGIAVFPVFAPGEAEYPSELPRITPKRYREHQQATKALESAPSDRKEALEKMLLSKEQLSVLVNMKRHTDFNDLAVNSKLGREAVERQVVGPVSRVIHEEVKQEKVKKQVQQTKRSVRM